MDQIDSKGFQALGPGALESYAHQKAGDIKLVIPDACLSGVLDNLAVLQTHAAILSAALEDRERPSTRTLAS
jgi:hypothetical protein